mmetsp:Transcript_70989/g.196521  ORF Transcript_70989/g.196521 Transcript_70989/m.196521 type:complete len:207 (+) Transcript_70989:384-1004(+)
MPTSAPQSHKPKPSCEANVAPRSLDDTRVLHACFRHGFRHGLLNLLLLREGRPEEDLQDSCGRGADERAHPHHPEVPHASRFVVPAAAKVRHHCGAEGPRGVDGAAVDGQEKDVRDEHSKANGESCVRARPRQWRDRHLPDHGAEQEGAHRLGDERAADPEVVADNVRAQVGRLVHAAREDCRQDARANQTAQELHDQIRHSLVPR